MATGHSHSHAAGGNEGSLSIALALTATFLVVEFVGGIVTQSLALISDAAHMLTDTAALAIALAAIRIGKRPADKRRTFGYHRFEILAAAFNAMLLFGVAVYILYEAYLRFRQPAEIQSTGMLAIAVAGMVVNVLSMQVLKGGKNRSLNVKGAYLEVWSDMLGSAGVILAALIIKATGWAWVDSAVAVLIGLWVLPRTWVLLRSSINVLLEGVPDDIDLEQVGRAILDIPGVESIHDLHVWALTSGKTSLTVHVVCDTRHAEEEVLPQLRNRLEKEFGIVHVTVQCERTPCIQADDEHHRFQAAAHAPGMEDHHHAHSKS